MSFAVLNHMPWWAAALVLGALLAGWFAGGWFVRRFDV